MPSRSDLLQLVAILEEEGFGALAGEVLTEISLGRQVEQLRAANVQTDGKVPDEPETVLVREPIAEDEQFDEALAWLRLRLVEPVRAFAQAEKIAGELSGRSDLRIEFIDPEDRAPIKALSVAEIGDDRIALELDELLERLPAAIEQTGFQI